MHAFIPRKIRLGRDANPLATGWAYYRVQQRVNGNWTTVDGGDFALDQEKWANTQGLGGLWVRLGTSTKVELDGPTRVVVRMSNRSSRGDIIVADSFELRWRDLHPMDKVVAIQACKLDVVNQVLKIERIKRITKVVLEFARDIAVDAAITAALAALGGPAAIAYKVVSVTNKVRKVEFISKATGAAIDITQAARRLARAHRNQLPKLFSEALDKGKKAEDIIRDGVELGIELVHAVSASLSWDSQRRVDKYLKDCEKSDISIWDDPWDIFIKAGYLDYVQSWHLTPAEPEPQPDPTPAPTPAPTQSPGGSRTLAISLGANNSGSNYCPFSQLACRWVNITLNNFPAGTYFTRCVWWHSQSSSERVPISGNITHNGGSRANLNNFCSFNVAEGRSIWVTIDGIRSNTLTFPRRR